jgi:hypothetical protein
VLFLHRAAVRISHGGYLGLEVGVWERKRGAAGSGVTVGVRSLIC